MSQADINIYFASQTGTAEDFARVLSSESKNAGLSSKVVDLAEVSKKSFLEQTQAIFIMSTHYEGEAPDNAEEFWKWFSDEGSHPKDWLSEIKFTVFALGDTTHDLTFAKIGQYDILNKLEKLID